MATIEKFEEALQHKSYKRLDETRMLFINGSREEVWVPAKSKSYQIEVEGKLYEFDPVATKERKAKRKK
jgi:hypothetical protein